HGVCHSFPTRRSSDLPAELQQAKALLLRQLPLAESSEDGVANALVRRAQIGLPLNEPERAAKRFYDLTADDVRAAFAKWIRPDRSEEHTSELQSPDHL